MNAIGEVLHCNGRMEAVAVASGLLCAPVAALLPDLPLLLCERECVTRSGPSAASSQAAEGAEGEEECSVHGAIRRHVTSFAVPFLHCLPPLPPLQPSIVCESECTPVRYTSPASQFSRPGERKKTQSRQSLWT